MHSSLARRLLSQYYLIQCAILSAFFLWFYPNYLRLKAIETSMGQERLLAVGHSSFTHEQEVYGMMFLVLIWKLAQSCKSIDEVLYHILSTLTITSWILTWLAGDRWALLGLSVLYLTVSVLLVPPSYTGNSNVTVLDGDSLHKLLQDRSSNTSHLVYYHVPWSANCRNFEPVFCKLSMAHTTAIQRFYSLNLDQNVDVCTELEIDTTTRSKQLPTLVLYFQGREIRRLPPFLDDGKVQKTIMNKKKVIQYFELDQDPSYRHDMKTVESKQKLR